MNSQAAAISAAVHLVEEMDNKVTVLTTTGLQSSCVHVNTELVPG